METKNLKFAGSTYKISDKLTLIDFDVNNFIKEVATVDQDKAINLFNDFLYVFSEINKNLPFITKFYNESTKKTHLTIKLKLINDKYLCFNDYTKENKKEDLESKNNDLPF